MPCECLEEGLSFQETDKTCIRVPPAVTCDKDCGSAECVLKDRTAQCKCPGSLVFDEANMACSEKAPAPAKDPCKARTVKCGKNFKCVVKNGQKAACECETGYTKRNNQCIAMCKACTVNAQCVVMGGVAGCHDSERIGGKALGQGQVASEEQATLVGWAGGKEEQAGSARGTSDRGGGGWADGAEVQAAACGFSESRNQLG
ncbi:unnamed protein product [Closterium sp. NIES-65]|nr:unnamed protein product [Closterium sp. NIES-65]